MLNMKNMHFDISYQEYLQLGYMKKRCIRIIWVINIFLFGLYICFLVLN